MYMALVFDLLKNEEHGPCCIIVNDLTTQIFMFTGTRICFKRPDEEQWIDFKCERECKRAFEWIMECFKKELAAGSGDFYGFLDRPQENVHPEGVYYFSEKGLVKARLDELLNS